MKSPVILTISLLIIALRTPAQISTDGTLGLSLNLSGPNFQITPDLGQQHGGNLYHSFQDFNLNSPETATFSGPNNVSNVISRVTGGNPSKIDGLIRSTMPNADMYFLNPYGIMFGPHARLDVQGSFHASTADYLQLGEEGRFDARNSNESLLTVAAVSAFGFLTNNPASISTQDSDLSVPENKTLSLIGGDIDLKGHSALQFDEESFMAVFASSKLTASGGQINLSSVASQGEVMPSEQGLDLKASGGQITANNTLVDVSGRGAGGVFIRAGELVMQDSLIQASTLADLDGKNLDMQLTESIFISGDLQSLSSFTFGSGDASSLLIKTPKFKNTSRMGSVSFGSGKSADIEIEAGEIWIENGGSIFNHIAGKGQSGYLHFKVKERLSLSGEQLGNIATEIFASSIAMATFSDVKAGNLNIETDHLNLEGGIISADSFGVGDAGEIKINANTAELTKGALISSTAFAEGNAGKINILIDDTLSISGQRLGLLTVPFGPIFENNDTGINSAAFSTGHAGQIWVEADTLLLANEADLSTSTIGEGSGGEMVIKSNHLHLINKASISSSAGIFFRDILSEVNGKGGNVIIEANHLSLSKGSSINSTNVGKNDAGNVTVQANIIHLEESSNIGTAAQQGAGGNISIESSERLHLDESEMTTSVASGKGSGGNITIANSPFVIMNRSQIIAQSDAGDGGNIHIAADQFIKSPESLISASSRLGLDGEIKIESPEVDINTFMLVLPEGFVEASLKQCTQKEIDNPSRFKINLSRKRSLPFEK